ncbi:MAG: hypothetical protein IPG83_14205 [Novosphingobium sp.]|nr:hypothetical protein [Novosphingobium sp.]
MMLAISFERPPQTVRRRIAARAAKPTADAGWLAVPSDWRHFLLTPRSSPPGVRCQPASRAAASRTRSAPWKACCKQWDNAIDLKAVPDAFYNAALSAADAGLSTLADRLTAATSRGWSLLLAGPSGTG